MAIPFLQALSGAFSFQITECNLRIRCNQLRARLHLYPVIILSQALLEPLFVWLFWNHADPLYLLTWLGCFYAIHTADILIWWRYREQLNTVLDCKRWSTFFKLMTALTAMMWGLSTWYFFPPDLAFQALMICLILGLVVGAVSLDSVYPPSLYIYVLGVTLPVVARLMIEGDETHLILASMLLVFLFVSLSASRELNKTFWKSLWQRYENDLLIEQLTEQKAIAEAANLNKSRFLASASHDLRQPMQALVLFSESLLEITQDQESQHLSTQISKSVGVLVDMFDELLNISKFDAGVVHAVKQNFNVQAVFDRLKNEFMPLAVAKDVQLIVPKTNMVAFSDPYLLERILRNLISNAIRYTDSGSVILCCQPQDNKLQFDVRDTGIGIRANSLPHIFDEYYQVDNQHRDRLKGLGLGLAIVRRMEALLDCHVTVVSKPGFGSVFSFIIPQGNKAVHIDQPLVTPTSKHDLSGITVAFIDDDLDIRLMATKLMTQWGCHVFDGELPHTVLNQMAAVGVCPDILICDYRLPHRLTAIDGINLLHELWGKHIPTVVLTGDTAPQTLQEIQASGALLLHKPIAPARLRSIMYFALHHKEP